MRGSGATPQAFSTSAPVRTTLLQDASPAGTPSAASRPHPSPATATWWPAEYVLTPEGSGWSVLNAEGQVLARVGDDVSLGGGEYPMHEDLGISMEAAPEACLAGPFWLVSKVVPAGDS